MAARTSSDCLYNLVSPLQDDLFWPLSRACSRFESCSIHPCPLRQYVGKWYADEEICTNYQLVKGQRWWKNQRKIAKVNRTAGEVPGYFDQELLESIKVVKPGITGINPQTDHRIRRRHRRPKPECHSTVDFGVERLGEEPLPLADRVESAIRGQRCSS